MTALTEAPGRRGQTHGLQTVLLYTVLNGPFNSVRGNHCVGLAVSLFRDLPLPVCFQDNGN